MLFDGKTLKELYDEYINSEQYNYDLSHPDELWAKMSRRARDLQCEREEGRDEGIELGQNQGKESKEREIVLNMFNKNFTLEQISTATKLTLDEINKIIEDSKNNDK